MMPKIYNKRYNDAPPNAVYVGRPTKWGNKWTHLKTNTLAEYQVDTIEDSIRSYNAWLFELFKDYEAFDEYVEGLEGKDLVCWCAPQGGVDSGSDQKDVCHAQGLMRLVDVHFTVKAFMIEGKDYFGH